MILNEDAIEGLRAALDDRLDETISIRVSSEWLAKVDAAVAEARKQGLGANRSLFIRTGTDLLIDAATARV